MAKKAVRKKAKRLTKTLTKLEMIKKEEEEKEQKLWDLHEEGDCGLDCAHCEFDSNDYNDNDYWDEEPSPHLGVDNE